jgi:hypothetical protein
MDRQAGGVHPTSVARLTLHRSAVAACFVVQRTFSPAAFWEFCNTINGIADMAGPAAVSTRSRMSDPDIGQF